MIAIDTKTGRTIRMWGFKILEPIENPSSKPEELARLRICAGPKYGDGPLYLKPYYNGIQHLICNPDIW